MPTEATATPAETFQERSHRETAYNRSAARVSPLLATLRPALARHGELTTYRDSLQDPSVAERASRQWLERIYLPIIVIIALLTLPFDSLYTFSSAASFLSGSITALTGVKNLTLATALCLSLVVLAITITVRLTTDARFDERIRARLPANDPRVEELGIAITRKRRVRGIWVAVFAAMLLAAAATEILTLHAEQALASQVRNEVTSGIASAAGMMALVTPYTVTFTLHMLLLFVPLPSVGTGDHFPCAPTRVEANLHQIGASTRETSRRIYDTIMAAPDEATRGRLASMMSESERQAINQALEREVFKGPPASGSGPSPGQRADSAGPEPRGGDQANRPAADLQSPGPGTSFSGVL